MTRDIDIVVALEARDADTIVRLFGPDCYVAREAVSEAISLKQSSVRYRLPYLLRTQEAKLTFNLKKRSLH